MSAYGANPVWMAADTDGLIVASESVDSRLPNQLSACVSFGVTLVFAAVLGGIGLRAHLGLGLAVMAAAVVLVSWWSRPLMSLVAAAFGWLMFDGFVVNQFGELRWHGAGDAVRLLILLAVAVMSSGVQALKIRLTRSVLIEEFPIARSGISPPEQIPHLRVVTDFRDPRVGDVPRLGEDRA